MRRGVTDVIDLVRGARILIRCAGSGLLTNVLTST